MGADRAAIHLIPISTIDLHLIEYALVVYLALSEHKPAPSPQDQALSFAINSLRQRIAAIIVPVGGEQSLPLDFAELILILSALTAYIDTLFRLIPHSQARDDIIAIFESIRSPLAKNSILQNRADRTMRNYSTPTHTRTREDIYVWGEESAPSHPQTAVSLFGNRIVARDSCPFKWVSE